MIIYAKIGTLPARRVKLYRKRTLPKVGERFKVYEQLDRNFKPESGTQPIGVLCDGIHDVGGELLYFCARF